MLSGQHFYHRTIRRNVIAFGSIFKNIQLVRYQKNTYNEISRFIVPLTYSGKENFLTRLYANPDLHKPTQILLPRMSFEITDISYDPDRKLSSFVSSFNKITGNNGEVYQQYSGVPYNIEFELNIYVRNVEDGTQIVEQIFPYFNPDYTVTMDFVDQMGISRNVPIILNDVKYDNSYEGDTETKVRVLIWTLRFRMKTYFFGPINTGKVIREPSANVKIMSTSGLEEEGYDSTSTYFLSNGNGTYRLREVVYQGTSLPDANSTAEVVSWNPDLLKLVVNHKHGIFNLNDDIRGSISNARYTVVQRQPALDTPTATIRVESEPPTANLDDDFGFTEIINEFPDNL